MLEELGKTITVAVICLSPAVAWASFSAKWKSNRDDIHARRKNQLKEVLRELETISTWASSEYEDSAHSDNWYNPDWAVRPFPSSKVREFNWREDTALFGEEIFDKLIPLERAIDNFEMLLIEHMQFRNSINLQMHSDIIQKISAEKKRTNQDRINPFQIQGQNQLNQDEIDCVKKLYELNKNIHVKGIGKRSDRDSLTRTFYDAQTYIENRLTSLKLGTPLSIWIGHILAIIVGLIGIGFLASFFNLLTPFLLSHLNRLFPIAN